MIFDEVTRYSKRVQARGCNAGSQQDPLKPETTLPSQARVELPGD